MPLSEHNFFMNLGHGHWIAANVRDNEQLAKVCTSLGAFYSGRWQLQQWREQLSRESADGWWLTQGDQRC